MRLPRVRFTVRWLMVVVAIVALSIGGGSAAMRLRKAAERYGLKARLHGLRLDRALHDLAEDEALADQWAGRARLMEQKGAAYAEPDGVAREFEQERRERIPKHRARADFHAAEKRKYERAARYPWLSVEPDPSEP